MSEKKNLFMTVCGWYLIWIQWLGKGVAAWSILMIASWWLASANGRLLVISPTPSLENKVFLIERLNMQNYSHVHRGLKGQVLAACLAQPQIVLAKENHLPYEINTASRWLGCEQGAWIKRVAAVGGDIVEISGGLITVNGAPLSVIPKMERGGEIRSIYSVAGIEGVFKLTENEVFLVGDHNLSFDSRYVGLFNVNQLKGRVTHAL